MRLEKKKEAPRDVPEIFKDVLRGMGFGPVVDRKKKIKKKVDEAQ